jgi:hypothetical protein
VPHLSGERLPTFQNRPGAESPPSMFELAIIEDMVHLMPAEFHKPMLDAVMDVINEKYMNKVHST